MDKPRVFLDRIKVQDLRLDKVWEVPQRFKRNERALIESAFVQLIGTCCSRLILAENLAYAPRDRSITTSWR